MKRHFHFKFFSTNKVMNDSQGVFFQYEPLWYEGKPYGISLTTLTPLFAADGIPSRWTFTLAKNIVILGIILLGNLLVIQVIRSENKILIFILNQSQKRQKRSNSLVGASLSFNYLLLFLEQPTMYCISDVT